MTNSIFWVFLIYSFLGWIIEVLYVGLITDKKFYNRGFLHLPIVPLYGFGALLIILTVYKMDTNIVVKLIMIIILTTLLEYLTALIMDNLFQIKWWDYSKRRFNIKGRVCLLNSVLFGIAGLFILVIQPHAEVVIGNLNNSFWNSIQLLILIAIMIDVYITLKKLTKIESRDIRYFSQGKILDPKYDYNIRYIKEIFAKNLLEYIFAFNTITLLILFLLTKDIILSLSLTILVIGISYIIMYGRIKKKF